jgi:hypothetical protein
MLNVISLGTHTGTSIRFSTSDSLTLSLMSTLRICPCLSSSASVVDFTVHVAARLFAFAH